MRPLTKYQKILIETRAAFDARLPLPPRPLGPGGQAESKTERKARALARPWKWDDIEAELTEEVAALKAELTEEVAALKADPSKIDDEHEYEGASPGEYRASVYLGSHVITPSSKVYMPWALGNLTPCPTCKGTGRRNPRNEIERIHVAEWWRLHVGSEKMDWPGENTPAWSAYIQRRNAVVDANEDGTLDCNECDGCGSHEARADQVWASEMSRLAEERGLVFEEENAYFVSLYFSIDENNEDENDNKPTMNYKGVA